MVRPYEVIVILDPALSEEEVETLVNDISETITRANGKVSEVQKWGRKRLAYEVKKRREGNYVLFRVEADPQVVSNLERNFKISEKVLKYLTVRLKEGSVPAPLEREESKEAEEVGVSQAGGEENANG